MPARWDDPAPPRERPLHAVLLSGVADAKRLIEPLARALDGTGPAILPLDAGLPAARLRQLLGAFGPVWPKTALSAAIVRSQQTCSTWPPPMA